MPVKHIDNETWKLVERINVKAVIAQQRTIKEGTIIKFLLRRGLANLSEKEISEIGK